MNRPVAVFFAAMVLLNLVYNSTLPLHFDEAYYWVWSKHLQWSYLDHPPMIAYLIRLATIAGDAEWQIRLVPLIASALTGFGIWRLASGLYGPRVGEKALIIFLLSPLAQMGFTLATPDVPLILGWTAAVFFIFRAVFENRPAYYIAAGLASGFAVLGKYTGVLLLPGVLLFFVFSSRSGELRRKEPYIGIGLAMLLFVPVILWNAGHDWMSFRFQLEHGLAGDRVLNLATFAEYVGVQAVALNPVFFLVLVYMLGRCIRHATDEKTAFLMWPCITVLVFFGYAALFKRVEGNWAAPAYVTGIVLIARWVDEAPRAFIYKTGIIMGLAMTMLLKVPEWFEFLPGPLVMKRQVLGYDTVFQSAGMLVDDSSLMLAADYKLASLAWYYLPGHPTVHVLTASRISQFDYWRQDLSGNVGRDAVFFGYSGQEPELANVFDKVVKLSPLYYDGRYISREIHVYQCRDMKVRPDVSSALPPSH